jgi:multiple sugar transport system substrate-binding protein
VSSLALAAATSSSAQDLGGELTFWGGLIFSDEANDLLVDEAEAWGEANGVAVEVVMINQNETVQRVSAAVESGTMPDVLDMNLELAITLGSTGVLRPLDALYDRIGAAQGGWYPSVHSATDTTAVTGGRVGIPFGTTGNMLLRRDDLLAPVGVTEPPATWDELVQQSAAVTGSNVWGLGLALSNVGDGNLQVSVLQSFGGRIADDEGQAVTIDSEATRAYLAWLKAANDQGVFPPGVATWDGAGDNQA